jgi:DNA polymerase-3 subunit gamma/tau
VEIDAASNRGVDDARELRERAMYAASGPNRHKVYIVDEAHMLTREAWNALLKILEEPPPGVVFVFATTEPQKIAASAAPVMSRVQRFDFRRIGPQSIVERLKWVVETDGIDVEGEALQLIAQVADGGMRDGLSLLDQALAYGEGTITAARVREALGLIDHETYAELLTLIAEKRTADVFPFVARLVEAGADLTEFVHGTGDVFRALLVQILGGKPEALTDSLRESVEQHCSRYTAGDVLRMLKLLAATENSIRRSPNARLHVEILLLQWSLLDRTVELTDVFDAMGGTAPTQVPPALDVVNPSNVEEPRNPEPVDAPTRNNTAESGDPSLESLVTAWPQVIQAVGRKRRIVREALSHATPTSVNEGVVEFEVSDCEVHLEGLVRNRAVIIQSIEDIVGLKVKQLEYRPQTTDREVPLVPPPARLDRNADQEERLKHHRQLDPGLDALAKALDLEVLE